MPRLWSGDYDAVGLTVTFVVPNKRRRWEGDQYDSLGHQPEGRARALRGRGEKLFRDPISLQ